MRQIKHADPYSPVTDFYKPLRQGIVRIHKAGKSRGALATLLQGIGDKRKLANYPLALGGYDAWWGTQQLKWFEPQKGKYPKYGFEMRDTFPLLAVEVSGMITFEVRMRHSQKLKELERSWSDAAGVG